MSKNESFQMTYSACQQEELQAIRKKYVVPEMDKLEQLRALDAGVEKKATAVSLSTGILGTLLMGTGMSLILSELGAVLGSASFPIGLLIGLSGIGILAFAYPLYVRTLRKEREKIAPEILRLTDELLK